MGCVCILAYLRSLSSEHLKNERTKHVLTEIIITQQNDSIKCPELLYALNECTNSHLLMIIDTCNQNYYSLINNQENQNKRHTINPTLDLYIILNERNSP